MMLIWIIRLTLALVALAGAPVWADDAPAKGLEKLLKETGIPYARQDDGTFEVKLQLQGVTLALTLREHTFLRLTEKDGSPVKVVLLSCQVVALEEDDRPSRDLLRKIAELNQKEMLIGNVGLEKQGVYYNSYFWLRTADREQLAHQLFIAHDTTRKLRKELEPFLKEK